MNGKSVACHWVTLVLDLDQKVWRFSVFLSSRFVHLSVSALKSLLLYFYIVELFWIFYVCGRCTQPAITCSKVTKETLEQGAKYVFFSIRVFFTDTGNSQDSRGREGTIFYSSLTLPPAHEHWYIYLQLCIWDDYHVFSIATLVFTRLLLDKIYHLIELPFEW